MRTRGGGDGHAGADTGWRKLCRTWSDQDASLKRFSLPTKSHDTETWSFPFKVKLCCQALTGVLLNFTNGNPQIDFKPDYLTCKEAHDYAEAGSLAWTKLHCHQHHMHVFTTHHWHLCQQCTVKTRKCLCTVSITANPFTILFTHPSDTLWYKLEHLINMHSDT